jgi:hypothetical protein
MAAWISVAIGLTVALVMITASVWLSFRSRPKGSGSILPGARQYRKDAYDADVTRSGKDHP